MPSGRWAAPEAISDGGRVYHRMLDMQDPSMFPEGVWLTDSTLGDQWKYADFNAFPAGFEYLVAIPVGTPGGPFWGVADHQPRFWPGPRNTTKRNGVYWEPTPYEWRGAGTLQFLVPYEVTDVLIVYPFHECPGVDFGKGLDPFSYDGDTVHEFARPFPDDLNSPDFLQFGDGVGVVHDFTELQNNWIAFDIKRVFPGPVRWFNNDPENPLTDRSTTGYSFADESHYDALMKVPFSCESDANYWIVQFNIYTPTGYQAATHNDQFLRPYVYAHAATAPPALEGTIGSTLAAAGICPSLPKGH